MIQKGINAYQLEKIAHLPENELEKSFILFINIFKIAYERRYILEKTTLTNGIIGIYLMNTI